MKDKSWFVYLQKWKLFVHLYKDVLAFEAGILNVPMISGNHPKNTPYDIDETTEVIFII